MSVRFADTEPTENEPTIDVVQTHTSTPSQSKVQNDEPTYEKAIWQGQQDEIDGDAMTNLTAVAESIESGDSDALVVALFETGQALKNCREYAIQVLVPLICQHATKWEYQLKLSAGETLLAAVNSGTIPENIARKIGRAATIVIGTPCLQPMFEAWSDTLVAVLKYVAWSAKQLDGFLEILETVYDSPSNVLSRQLIARVLGSLAASSKEDEGLKRRVLDRALDLSGDKNVIVRGMVAESFAYIGASVSLSVVEREIWPRLVKLLRDSDARVHAASLQSLSFISAAHREKGEESKFFAELLGPIFMKECARIRRDAAEDQRDVDEDKYLLLEVNSEIFGELLYTCNDCLPDEGEKKEVYKAFLAMCTANGPVVRRYCAYNIPAVSLCLSPKYRAELASLVRFLSQDNDHETRWVLAAGLHETVRILACRETVGDLLKAVQELFEDEKTLVRKNILYHFEEMLADLSKHSGYGVVQKLAPLFQNLDVLTGENWTVQVALARQLELAASLIPPPSLKMDVIPLLYQLADHSAYIGRKAVMSAIATCMRYIPDVTERDEVMGRFVVEWARGSVFWMRLAFLDAAESAVKIYSRCLFRDTFGLEVLRLAMDQVANVRLRTAHFLPKIAAACNQMEEFHTAIETLKGDEDIDVLYAMEGIDEKVREALKEGHETFEANMKLEEEEQELFSRHLQAQREVQKRKNAKKHRGGIFRGKVSKSHSSASKAIAMNNSSLGVVERDGEAGESPSSKTIPGVRHQRASGTLSFLSGNQAENASSGGKPPPSPRKSATKTNLDTLAFDEEESGASSAAVSGRSLKGLIHFVSPKGNHMTKKSSRTKKTSFLRANE